MNFVAINIETANGNRSSICGIGIAMVHKGAILDSVQFLIKPTPNTYDALNSESHGIRDRHTRDLQTFQEQWEDIRICFEDQVIVAHNAALHCGALRAALDASELTYPDFDFYCTLLLSKASLPVLNPKLESVARHLNIEREGQSPENRARMAAMIAIRLCELNGVDSMEALTEKLGFLPGWIVSEPKSFRAFAKG